MEYSVHCLPTDVVVRTNLLKEKNRITVIVIPVPDVRSPKERTLPRPGIAGRL